VAYDNQCPFPFYSFSISFAAGASNPVTPVLLPSPIPSQPSLPGPFDNTKEVLILNLSQADNLLVQIDSLDTPPVSLDRATVIPPGYSITLAIGPVGYRQELGKSVLGWTLWYWPAGGVATVGFDANITYVQTQGGGGMVAP